MIQQNERIQPLSLLPPPVQEDDAEVLAPYFLLRVTGMAFSILDQLQLPRTVAMVEEMLDLEQQQSQQQDSLLAALTAHSKLIDAKDVGHKSLDLRRAILSQNGHKAYRLVQAIEAYLPAELAVNAYAWCQRAIRQSELLVSGEATLQEELVDCRRALRQLARDEDFQRGLLLSSTTLYTELQHYLATPPEKSNNRLRRTEEGLLSYLIRMVTKTSPYSTFTSTSLGLWQDTGTQPANMAVQDWGKQSVIRFHTGLISNIAHELALRPEIRLFLRPKLNPTISWFLDPPSHTGEGADGKIEFFVQEKANDKLYKRYQEHLMRLRLNPLRAALLHEITQRREAWTYQELVEHLAKPTSEFAGYTTEEITTTLDYLAEKGVLFIDLRLPAHQDDKIAFLIEQLAPIPGEWVTSVRAALCVLQELIAAYAAAPAIERLHLLEKIRQHTQALCDDIGSQRTPPWDATEAIQRAYPSLILEDTTLAFQNLGLDRSAWGSVRESLACLQKISPLLDIEKVWNLVVNSLSSETFAQLQPANDLIAHHQHFSRTFSYNRSPKRNWREVCPQLEQLMHQRQSFIRLITDRIQEAITVGASSMALDLAEIRQFTRRLPAFLYPHYALAHFGQLYYEQGNPQMVLNYTWPGPGPAFSRFSYLLHHPALGTPAVPSPTFSALIRSHITRLGQKHGGIYASIAETGDINVNTHDALTPYEIIFPGSESLYPAGEQLHLRDLRLIQNPMTHELHLFSEQLNSRIYPLHLGFSVTEILPPLYQALVAPTSHYPVFNLVALLEDQLSSEQRAQIRHYPRIALGSVVLNRECWKIPRSIFPQREAGESAFSHFVKMNRWRKAQGLPVEGFRRAVSRSEYQARMQNAQMAQLLGDTSSGQEKGEQHPPSSATQSQDVPGGNFHAVSSSLSKPFYVHFHSYLLLSLLNGSLKSLGEEATITFEEMLPTAQQHLLHRGEQSYATEVVLEVS